MFSSTLASKFFYNNLVVTVTELPIYFLLVERSHISTQFLNEVNCVTKVHSMLCWWKKKQTWMDSEGPATFQDTENATSSIAPSTRTLYLNAEEPKIYRQRRVSRDRFHMGTFKGFPSLVGTEEGKRVAQSPYHHTCTWTTEMSRSKEPPWLRNSYLNQGQRTLWPSSCPLHLNFHGLSGTPLRASGSSSGK